MSDEQERVNNIEIKEWIEASTLPQALFKINFVLDYIAMYFDLMNTELDHLEKRIGTCEKVLDSAKACE